MFLYSRSLPRTGGRGAVGGAGATGGSAARGASVPFFNDTSPCYLLLHRPFPRDQMRFNLDLHIGVIGDIEHIFRSLGHEVTNWSISAHTWVFNRKPAKVDVVINTHGSTSIKHVRCLL